VANSGKKISQLKQTTNTDSTNPASTPTANPETWPTKAESKTGHRHNSHLKNRPTYQTQTSSANETL
jgi:hypothetical protein